MSHDTDRERRPEIIGGGRTRQPTEEEMKAGVRIIGQHPSPDNVKSISKNEPDPDAAKPDGR